MDMTQSSEPVEQQVEVNPIKKHLWSIDNPDGQISAPPEDDEQKKFLSNTTWTQ